MDDLYYYLVIKKAEYVKIKKRKECWEQVTLTDNQIAEIQSIYGKAVDTRWHRYFQYFTGKFNAQYLPDTFFALSMECKLNPRKLSRELEDKIRLPIIYGSVPGLVIPRTIVSNASGIYYDESYNVISKETAHDIVKKYLKEHRKAILKPTRDTGGGEGIEVLTQSDFDTISLEKNFIIQECVVNQNDIRILNPSSLNTMRIITYICDEKYWCAPIAMRMGCGISPLDNITSGGICIGIKENGDLCDQAYTEYCVKV